MPRRSVAQLHNSRVHPVTSLAMLGVGAMQQPILWIGFLRGAKCCTHLGNLTFLLGKFLPALGDGYVSKYGK